MNPNQTDFWLGAALAARTMCGVGDQRRPTNLAEQASLNSLKRGLFAKRDIEVNEALNTTNTYLAFPPEESQLKASDCSKYIQIIATQKIFFNQPVFHSKVQIFDARDELQSIVNRIKDFLKQGNIVVPNGVDLEISHHYGLNQFDQFGMAMITVVNREYCKKLLILLPHQAHPEQYHENKEETFHLLHGELEIVLNGQAQVIHPGTVITIDPGMRHAFKTITGAVIEEISSTHFKNDSFYTDPNIMNNANRKTFLSYWN
jgi:quercetin dioxygenase-like cupin family protein